MKAIRNSDNQHNVFQQDYVPAIRSWLKKRRAALPSRRSLL